MSLLYSKKQDFLFKLSVRVIYIFLRFFNEYMFYSWADQFVWNHPPHFNTARLSLSVSEPLVGIIVLINRAIFFRECGLLHDTRLAVVQSNLTRNIQPHSVILGFPTLYFCTEQHAVAQLVYRHGATSQRVADLIPDGVMGFAIDLILTAAL